MTMREAKNRLRLLLTLVLVSGALFAVVGPVAGGSVTADVEARPAASTPSKPGALEPVVRYDVRHDTSPALSLIQQIPPKAGPLVLEMPRLTLAKTIEGGEPAISPGDPVLQDRSSTANLMPSPIRSFEGVDNRNGVLPPDTQGDVGPSHYVQWVNLSFAVWDKAGNLLYGPTAGNTLWSGFGGPCETTNDGDPVTLYDHLADRWLMSQFALPNYPDGPYYECIAISQTPDPTGPWHRYEFLASNTKMNDYPKLGVWPDGYYMTVNQFIGASSWGGAGVFAFERDKMLLGQSAQMIYFDLYSVESDFGGMLPSDLDGSTPPPAGAPNYFVEVDDATWILPTDALRLWEFHADWTTPTNSTFGLSGQPNAVVPVTSFTPLCMTTTNCIPQPGTSVRLDGIGDRLMYRLSYRNMGTHESLVVNHTVDAGGGMAGIRWYEVRDPGGTPVIYQQGTYAPADGLHRWMGSIAMDGAGNIALGYSVSSSSVYPSVRYAGRLADDPLGTMGQGEVELIAGGGSQTNSASRWGDYSTMSIDSVDDCTFWYTQEYLEITSSASWQTRIGSFRFPNCAPAGQGTLAGIVRDSATLDPIVGAQVQASSSPTQTYETASGVGGGYTLTLASGVYTVTGSVYGYYPDETAGVSVSEGVTTSLDILLTPAPTYVVSGTVTDAVTGWPLYARIDVDGYGGGVVWNDAVTGFYSITLAGETPYTFNVYGWVNGYLPGARSVGPLVADATVDLTLAVDADACDAPGYVMVGECRPSPGGLVVGNVYDGHTGAPLNGAIVTSDSGGSATAGTTMDPAVDDGFYTIFSLAGPYTLTATHYHYGPAVVSPTVVQSDTVRQSFSLPAGWLSYHPAGLAVTLTWGTSGTVPFTLTNVGDVAASFELVELEPGAGPVGPFQTPDVIVKPFKQSFSTTLRVNLPDPPTAPPYPAGAVIRSWPAGVRNGWGIALIPSWTGDGEGGAVWLASPSARWGGDNRLYEHTPDGTPTGRSHPFAWSPPFGPADGAVNWHTGMLWVMNIDSPGSSNCIYEIDPAQGFTGDRICPSDSGFANSQRGLAYDPADDTWYAGGWNDRTIYRFDSAGTVLQAVDVGLGISGLAYNPDTRHLFVMVNDDASPVFVLDVAGGYAPVGQFSVGAGFDSYGGAGLEFDCAGNLWAVDQATDTVYQFASGETTALCLYDLPWLSAAPIAGAVGPASSQVISVTFDASQLDVPNWGVHYARLKIEHDTPYSLTDVPLTMTVEPPPPSLTITKMPASDPAGIGLPLRYTVTISNAGGPATGVIISDTLPADVEFTSAGHGGVLMGGDVVWGGLSVAGVASLSVAFTVTVDCISPGTSIANAAYQVTATEWPTPVLGRSVTVTAVAQDAIAGFDFPTPVVRGAPARFANLSQNSAVYEWDFGDGLTSTLSSPTHTYAATGSYTVTLTARTLCGGDDQASQTLTVHEYGGTIGPATATGLADPGMPFTYTLQLTNTGTLSDSFDLSLGSYAWDTALSSTRVEPLAPGESGSFEVTVTAAPEALAGDWDHVIVTATAVSDPRTPRTAASSILTTTANPIYDVTLLPIGDSQSGVPGMAAAYFLQAINTGNASDTYTVSRLSGKWPISILPSGNFTLAASAQQAILVQVTVPVTATTVERDVSKVQVLAGSGMTGTSRLTTSVACVGLGGASFTYVPTSPVAGEQVAFTGRVSVGTPPVTYTWDFGDDSPLLVRGGGTVEGEVFTHTYGIPGIHRVVMTAANCYGASTSTAAHVVTVRDAPDVTVQPAGLAAALSAGEARSVTLTIGNVGTAGLWWTLASVPVVDWLTAAKTGGDLPPLGNTDVVITFTAPLTTAVPVYTTVLHVNSNDPDEPDVTVPVTLTVTAGCERITGISFSHQPATPVVGSAVVFTGTAAAGTAHLPVTYTWDFGDGSVGRVGRTVAHSFPLTTVVRPYTVTLTVANACPSWGMAEKTITVRPHAVYLSAITRAGGSVWLPAGQQIRRLRPREAGTDPVPALVQVDLRSSTDLKRIVALLGSLSPSAPGEGTDSRKALVYAHLFDFGGQECLLLPADPLQQRTLIQQGLSLRVLDPDSRDAAYYMLHVRHPGALRQARALVTILDEDENCGSAHLALPTWTMGVGTTGCQVLARATASQAERLAELGMDLQPLVLHPLAQRSVDVAVRLPAGVAFSPLIHDIVNRVHTTTVASYDGGLSGEWPVIVGGVPYTIVTRYSHSGEPISKATYYAYEHFQQVGLDVAFHEYDWNGNHWRNVIAEQRGTTDPEEIVLITAHIDDMPSGPLAPGADDNASGVAAVLIAADILSQYHFSCTLRYVLFTGEEQGLRGSAAYAAQVYAAGEEIAGILNLDMIAHNSDAAPMLDLHVRSAIPASVQIADTFSQVVTLYNLGLVPDIIIDYWLGDYSDNKSFWDRGYPAILAIEDEDDFTPYYHTTGDRLSTLDIPYFTRFVKAAVGTIGYLAGPLDGYLDGRVYDDGTGVSVAGATVEASFSATPVWSTTTGADGTYHLMLQAGMYTVTAVAPWYVSTITTGIRMPGGQAVTLDIPLRPIPCDGVVGADVTYVPAMPWVSDEVVFTGSIRSGTGSLPITYTWDFGDGSPLFVVGIDDSMNGGSVVTHTFPLTLAVQTYTVTMAVANICSGPQLVQKGVTVQPYSAYLPIIVKEEP